MPSDHEVAFAFIARRQALRAMTAQRWSHFLSLELGWMNPGQGRLFVDGAVRAGILAADGDELRFVLDPQAIAVPRGFRPRPDGGAGDGASPRSPPAPSAHASASHATQSPAPPAPPEPDLFLAWVAKLAAHRQGTREQVLGQVAALQGEMGGLLTAEAAVLLLARRSGLDVVDAARAAGARMVMPGRAGRARRAPAGSP